MSYARIRTLALALSISAVVAGATSASAASFDQTSGIRSMNKVGLDLLRESIKTDAKKPEELKNALVSPLSAFTAFSMLRAGLRGETQKNFDQFLALDRDFASNFDAQSSALIGSLRSTAPTGESPGKIKKPVVAINNSAWATNGATTGERFEFAPAFATSLKFNYQATVESLDFVKADSARVINHWASQQTKGMIQNVITPDILKSLDWLLINATYLEANWAAKFQAVKAAVAPRFHRLDGKRVAVEMIRTRGQLNLLEKDGYRAVEVPFYDSDLSFFVVMPEKTRDFLSWTLDGGFFNLEKWGSLTEAFSLYETSPVAEATEVTLRMPKLSFGFSKTILKNQPLTTSLGLDFLFDFKNQGDFAPLGGIVGRAPGSVVGLIKQDTKIELDENGVKAAAVTQIGGIRSTSRAPPRFKKDIVIDKPFVFFIGSKRSQAILFAGVVVDPIQK